MVFSWRFTLPKPGFRPQLKLPMRPATESPSAQHASPLTSTAHGRCDHLFRHYYPVSGNEVRKFVDTLTMPHLVELINFQRTCG